MQGELGTAEKRGGEAEVAQRIKLANEAAEALLKEEAEAAEKMQQSRSKAAKKKAKKSAK